MPSVHWLWGSAASILHELALSVFTMPVEGITIKIYTGINKVKCEDCKIKLGIGGSF